MARFMTNVNGKNRPIIRSMALGNMEQYNDSLLSDCTVEYIDQQEINNYCLDLDMSFGPFTAGYVTINFRFGF